MELGLPAARASNHAAYRARLAAYSAWLDAGGARFALGQQARRMGVCPETIRKWRRALGLPKYGRNRPSR